LMSGEMTRLVAVVAVILVVVAEVEWVGSS
jgi:hypothetical protein